MRSVKKVLAEASFEVLCERREELFGRLPLLVRADECSEIFCHCTRLDRLDDDVLKDVREFDELVVAVQFSAVREAARPRKNRRNRVGRRGLSLLPLTVVTSNRAVSSL